MVYRTVVLMNMIIIIMFFDEGGVVVSGKVYIFLFCSSLIHPCIVLYSYYSRILIKLLL